MKCQSCKTNKAVWRVGAGFEAKTGKRVCDNYACRAEATGGYPATMTRLKKG